MAATSVPGEGTTFTIRIPLGAEHLPTGAVVTTETEAATATAALPYIDEALRWLPDANTAGAAATATERGAAHDGSDGGETSDGAGKKARVLVVDDNHDMRHYVARLLSERYEVRAAPDGVAALEVMERVASRSRPERRHDAAPRRLRPAPRHARRAARRPDPGRPDLGARGRREPRRRRGSRRRRLSGQTVQRPRTPRPRRGQPAAGAHATRGQRCPAPQRGAPAPDHRQRAGPDHPFRRRTPLHVRECRACALLRHSLLGSDRSSHPRGDRRRRLCEDCAAHRDRAGGDAGRIRGRVDVPARGSTGHARGVHPRARR